ncbi:hypothetical protein K504DRAFT_372011 [Pleomassaria siparia CBS 279.74]|uniref:Heterokaryon incompatibility domain-containing protein n=1 Tax=Pleomassaria siparia CBS 279.74 TaxID=1314801 RepID=A0A6G1KI89_9PLEO|nr:hypothetical protein K504DRAFT_372011 [Pleomassaria siparia CBS 279.74]
MEAQHLPLETSVFIAPVRSAWIRLLQFSRKSNHDGISSTWTFTGRLQDFELSEAPPFYTASYVWGENLHDQSTTTTTTIALESGTLPVLSSLTPFLNMVCAHTDFSAKDWWWIDSLCINLKDTQEREDQVKIMGSIYQRAKRVIIWLGEEREPDSDCTGVTRFLSRLSSLPPEFRTNKALRTKLLEKKLDAQWRGVGRLLCRKWWTRVWTLQEYVLPPEARFYCGRHSISRGKFKSAMYNIHLCSTGSGDYSNELIPRHAFDAAFNRRRIHQWYQRYNGMGLVALMAYLGNQSATDARDMIYSVLGLINEQDRRLVGTAEYTSSVEHIYAKLVRSFWNEYQSLDIICFSHLFNPHSGNLNPPETGGGKAVPSWAPDWRARVEFSSPVPLMVSQSASEYIGNFRPLGSATFKAKYDAPGPNLKRKANVRFDDNLKEMWCDGVILDTVEGLGGLEDCQTRCRSHVCRDSGHEVVQSVRTGQEEGKRADASLAIVQRITRSLVLDRRDKYLRFHALEQYVSSFLVLCHACIANDGCVDNHGESVRPIDELFAVWWQQNKHVRIGLKTMEQHITTTIAASTNPSLFSQIPIPTLQPSYYFVPPSPKLPACDNPESEDQDSYLTRFHDTVRKKSRKLMVTSQDYIGMAPCRARLGDVVAVLFGCSIPLLMRRVGVREAWTIVGEAYVDGFMGGQVERMIANGDAEVVKLRIV